MDPWIGEVRIFPYMRYAPQGWLRCDGRTYSIRQYQALFAIIGDTYGGDGINTFKVPDLQGRAIVGAGQGPGLSEYEIGVPEGQEQVALTLAAQLPTHTHAVTFAAIPYRNSPSSYSTKAVAQKSYPSRYFYNITATGNIPVAAAYSKTATEPAPLAVYMATDVVAPSSGQSLPHENRQPFLALLPCICWDGVYPERPD